MRLRYRVILDEICALHWEGLSRDDLIALAQAYYYFSVQFRENLQTARALYPQDGKLAQLEAEECGTANLSPWPGVAEPGEAMDHDEFLRRLLCSPPDRGDEGCGLSAIGENYLLAVRTIDPAVRALSIASYEDGGLDRVFRAFLRAPDWQDLRLQAFRHFLTRHLGFDGDPVHGHGALSRHLRPDDRILPLWVAFKTLLVKSVPRLENS